MSELEGICENVCIHVHNQKKSRSSNVACLGTGKSMRGLPQKRQTRNAKSPQLTCSPSQDGHGCPGGGWRGL